MSREGRRRWGFNQRFVIGKQNNPMMERWRLAQTPWFGVYVHFIYREDLDPTPHDHPWAFWRFILRGGYVEEYLADPASAKYVVTSPGRRRWSHFPTSHAHRIRAVEPGTVSVVLVGRKRRTWGFWHGGVWTDYRDALGLRPNEGVTP